MSEFDLVIKGGTVATASDVVPCDVGIKIVLSVFSIYLFFFQLPPLHGQKK